MSIIWMDCCATSSMIGAFWESGRYEKLLFYAVLLSGHMSARIAPWEDLLFCIAVVSQ